MIRSGAIGPDDSVYCPAVGEWRPARDVVPLFGPSARGTASLATSPAATSPGPAAPQAIPPAGPPPAPAAPSRGDLVDARVAPVATAGAPWGKASPPPSPAARPPTEGDWKYSRNGQIGRAASREEVAAMIDAGRLGEHDQVFHESLGSWLPVSAVRGVLTAGAPQARSAPAPRHPPARSGAQPIPHSRPPRPLASGWPPRPNPRRRRPLISRPRPLPPRPATRPVARPAPALTRGSPPGPRRARRSPPPPPARGVLAGASGNDRRAPHYG